MPLLRAVYDGVWRFESEMEEWVVAEAWAFPCDRYRRLLSVCVRNDWHLPGVRLKWRPEIDPFAFSLNFQCVEVLLCWHEATGALVLLVPSEAAFRDQDYYRKITEAWLQFLISLLADPRPIPMSSFHDEAETEGGLAHQGTGEYLNLSFRRDATLTGKTVPIRIDSGLRHWAQGEAIGWCRSDVSLQLWCAKIVD